MMKKTENSNKKKSKITVVIIAILVLIVMLILAAYFLFFHGKASGSMIKRGLIESEGRQSDEYDGLFLENGDSYLINMDLLDDCLDLTVVRVDNGYAIRTTKNQITILTEEPNFIINSNKISDDDSYIAPVIENGYVYGDTKTIFDTFGYGQEFSETADGSKVKLQLIKEDNDPYETIRAIKPTSETLPETEPQIEAAAVEQSPGLNKPGEGEPETLPRPTEQYTPSDEEGTSEGNAQGERETIPVVTPKETEARVERPESANAMTDEEFSAEWAEDKSELVSIFKGAVSYSDDVPSCEVRNDDFIAYNPMSKGIYYDGISVVHDPITGEFVTATFDESWSDLVGVTDSDRTNAFYAAVPEVVKSSLVSLLGQNAGTELFNFIKEHADKKSNGGYIYTHDANGSMQSQWTDEPVGDGIMASELDFSDWQGRFTDNGLRYSVSRNGNGFIVQIFKD